MSGQTAECGSDADRPQAQRKPKKYKLNCVADPSCRKTVAGLKAITRLFSQLHNHKISDVVNVTVPPPRAVIVRT